MRNADIPAFSRAAASSNAGAIQVRLAKLNFGKDAALFGGSFDFPTVEDGALGVRFIHRAVESSEKGDWMQMEDRP